MRRSPAPPPTRTVVQPPRERAHSETVRGLAREQAQFYVCENAHYYGNLAEFLEDDEHGVLFWRLFKQVAQGLKFLHDTNTTHGGLKCYNILVGAKYTAKLADFGFSTASRAFCGFEWECRQGQCSIHTLEA